MRCEEVRLRMAEHLAGTLDPHDAAALRAHVSSCASCQAEYDGFDALWSALGTLPAPEAPSNRMRERFSAVLAAERASSPWRPASRQHEGRAWTAAGWTREPLVQMALAASLLLAGVVIGRSTSPAPAATAPPATDIAEVRGELRDMRQMLTLSLLQQQSATERLRNGPSVALHHAATRAGQGQGRAPGQRSHALAQQAGHARPGAGCGRGDWLREGHRLVAKTGTRDPDQRSTEREPAQIAGARRQVPALDRRPRAGQRAQRGAVPPALDVVERRGPFAAGAACQGPAGGGLEQGLGLPHCGRVVAGNLGAGQPHQEGVQLQRVARHAELTARQQGRAGAAERIEHRQIGSRSPGDQLAHQVQRIRGRQPQPTVAGVSQVAAKGEAAGASGHLHGTGFITLSSPSITSW